MITSASNGRIKEIVNLIQKAKVRREKKVFIIEGILVSPTPLIEPNPNNISPLFSVKLILEILISGAEILIPILRATRIYCSILSASIV